MKGQGKLFIHDDDTEEVGVLDWENNCIKTLFTFKSLDIGYYVFYDHYRLMAIEGDMLFFLCLK